MQMSKKELHHSVVGVNAHNVDIARISILSVNAYLLKLFDVSFF